jgi:hypothetical protein
VSPGSSLIEIDLIEQDGGTLLRMPIAAFPMLQRKPATAKAGRITSAG